MKVKDTLDMDLLYASLPKKIKNLVATTPYLHCNRNESIGIIKQYCPSWQYNGAAPFDDILFWCEGQFGDYWSWNWETIYFKDEKDQTAFLLRWA